jgi:2-methylcitrate dehydratase PrpD
MPGMLATQDFARYAAEFNTQPTPGEVMHHAKRAVVDWYASAYCGCSAEPVRLLEEVLAEDLDRGSARLVVGRRATPRAAALINGAAAHAAEVDDSFREAMYHPGAPTIAAALAVAHGAGSTGKDLLSAIVLGYEVSTRIGVVLGRGHYHYWHNTGTVGTFGAAAAAGALLALNEAQFAHALATAATFAAGLQQAFRMDSMSKPLHAGRAAEAGLLAAQLAARGVTGSLDVLDGATGMGAAMSTGADWSQIAATLGLDFHITRITFKNHIGCGHTFPAIDAALELQRRHRFRAEDVASIRIGTYQAALDVACHARPSSANEARFSIPYVVATALVHGSVRTAAYETQRLHEPATRELLERISVCVDPELDAAFPGRRGARIEIVLRDGRSLTHLQRDRKGDPELPLGDADLEAKLMEFASPVIGAESAKALADRAWTLDTGAMPP